jgi:hypothetical protein
MISRECVVSSGKLGEPARTLLPIGASITFHATARAALFVLLLISAVATRRAG